MGEVRIAGASSIEPWRCIARCATDCASMRGKRHGIASRERGGTSAGVVDTQASRSPEGGRLPLTPVAALALSLYANGHLLFDAGHMGGSPQALFSDRYRHAFAEVTRLHPPFAAYYFACAALFQVLAAWRDRLRERRRGRKACRSRPCRPSRPPSRPYIIDASGATSAVCPAAIAPASRRRPVYWPLSVSTCWQPLVRRLRCSCRQASTLNVSGMASLQYLAASW